MESCTAERICRIHWWQVYKFNTALNQGLLTFAQNKPEKQGFFASPLVGGVSNKKTLLHFNTASRVYMLAELRCLRLQAVQ